MGPHGSEIGWPSPSKHEQENGWPAPTKPDQDKKARKHNHHLSLKERIKSIQHITHEKHPKLAASNQEARKAAAWAVFQHHGGGGISHIPTLRSAVRRPSRFKIEAQMKQEIMHRSVPEAGAASWDAGSTLFDSFELDALLKTLGQAANPAGVPLQKPVGNHADGAGAMVVYSQKHWIARPQPPMPPQRIASSFYGQRSLPTRRELEDASRLDTVDETRPLKASQGNGQGLRSVSYKLAGNITLEELYKQVEAESNDVFSGFPHTPSPFNVRKNARRSFDSSTQDQASKGGAHDHIHRSRWRNLLHTLHLDGANSLFQRFQGFHAQVAPHDPHKKLEQKLSRGRGSKSEVMDSHGQKLVNGEKCDPRIDSKKIHISKDAHSPVEKIDSKNQPHSWKFGLKAVLSRPFSRQGSLVSENGETDLEGPQKSDKHQGQKKADLQSAWSSLTAKLQHYPQQDQGRQIRAKYHSGELSGAEPLLRLEHHHHYHHHHHHVAPESQDYELSLPAISRRVSRSSLDEKTRRFSTDDGGGLKVPRDSLDPTNAYEERAPNQLTPWEAESGISRRSFVH